jgi:hypothetical protein
MNQRVATRLDHLISEFYLNLIPNYLSQIWDPITRKLLISRDVIFEEESMMKFEGSDGTKEEDYFSIFPIIDNEVVTFSC